MGKSNSAGSMSAAERGRAKKRENEAIKRQQELDRHEERVAKQWEVGSDTRGKKRAEESESRARELDEKRREKQLLEQEEAAQFASYGKPKTKKGKKTEEEKMLQELFEKQQEKDRQAQQKQREVAAKRRQEEERLYTRRTEDGEYQESDDLPPIEENLNRQLSHENSSSGLDAALTSLSIEPVSTKNSKALYKAFEEREYARIKEENPRLKRTQINDKVFSLWRKSPENPANQR